MKELTRAEHVTALFVIAWYHWWIDDKNNALNAIEVAVHVADSASTGSA